MVLLFHHHYQTDNLPGAFPLGRDIPIGIVEFPERVQLPDYPERLREVSLQ